MAKKACCIPANKKAEQLGMGTFAKYAVRNLNPMAEDYDFWSPPRPVRYHTTYQPANICGLVIPNDLISVVTSNVLHTHEGSTSNVLTSDLDYWTRPMNCHVCADHDRNANRICVVCTTDDVKVLEQTVDFDGVYHVIGRLPEADGQGRDETRIRTLLAHIGSCPQEAEVILALGSDEKGATAATYLTGLLAGENGPLPKAIKVTTLEHVRQGDAEFVEDGKAACAICGIQTPTVERFVDPNSARIAWCADTRLEVLVHERFYVPCADFDAWCENFNDPPSQGLHQDILDMVRNGFVDVYETPYTHTGYLPDQKGWTSKWTDNVERIFRDMRTNRLSEDMQSFKPYPRALRSFQGFCGFRDPLNRNNPGRLTWFFFGQLPSREDMERKSGRRGWIVFMQVGNLQAMCATYMAELVDGTFDEFFQRHGLIIPDECFVRDDREAKKRLHRKSRKDAADKPADKPEVGAPEAQAKPDEPQVDDGASVSADGEDVAPEPAREPLSYDNLFGGSPNDAGGDAQTASDVPSDTPTN